MQEVAVGLIGCGFFAQNHLHAWRDLGRSGVRLAAVCDSDPTKARAAAQAFEVPRFFTDARAMLEAETLDLIDVVTRMDSHLALVRLAAPFGVGLVVQKPLAPDWQDAVEIVRITKEAGVFLAVHENFRFQTPMRAVKRVLESGAIGAPSWARISFRTGFDVYRTQPYFLNEERLAILDVGIHVLDLARFLLGEVEHVSCETQRRNPKVKAEDTATMLLRHESGAVSVVECTYEARRLPDPFPQTLLEIEGPRGSILLHPDFRMAVTSDGVISESFVGGAPLPWTERPWHTAQESVLHTCAHILERFSSGGSAETSGEDNLRTYALVEAAYASAASGRRIRPLSAALGNKADAA
jgi:predicted dehydrogenase